MNPPVNGRILQTLHGEFMLNNERSVGAAMQGLHDKATPLRLVGAVITDNAAGALQSPTLKQNSAVPCLRIAERLWEGRHRSESVDS